MRRLPMVLFALALVAAGCAKERPSKGAGTTEAPPVTLTGSVNIHGSTDVSAKGAAVEVALEADDFSFSPTFVKAAPGATVTIELENEGKSQHTFTIDSPAVNQVIDPGTRKRIVVTLPADGVVNFYCRFHRGQGMQGAFHLGKAAEEGYRSY